eukprot:scaffold26101_cov60-Phaeocystis_antarctica.AAC.3
MWDTHTQNRQGAAHARAHAGAPASVILRANHVDLHHARPLTLALPLPPEDTVDLGPSIAELSSVRDVA